MSVSLRQDFWPLLGHWTGTEQGEGGPARAMITLKLDLADGAVVEDYRRVAGDGAELAGHGVFVGDPGTGDVLWWWFDSSGIPPTGPLRGRWADDVLVLGPGSEQEHRLWLDGDRLRREAPGLTGAYARITVGH